MAFATAEQVEWNCIANKWKSLHFQKMVTQKKKRKEKQPALMQEKRSSTKSRIRSKNFWKIVFILMFFWLAVDDEL